MFLFGTVRESSNLCSKGVGEHDGVMTKSSNSNSNSNSVPGHGEKTVTPEMRRGATMAGDIFEGTGKTKRSLILA